MYAIRSYYVALSVLPLLLMAVITSYSIHYTKLYDITADSVQAQWLQERMTASTAPWQVVYFHHPPYSSDGNTHLATASDSSTYRSYGSRPDLQWPFAEWGADAVLTAHSHFYERLEADGVMYFINGLVLPRWFSDFGEPVPESP